MLGNTTFVSRLEHDISHSFAALTREISCSTLEISLVFPRTHVLLSIYSTLWRLFAESKGGLEFLTQSICICDLRLGVDSLSIVLST